MNRVLRMFKSSIARRKRRELKELKEELQERKYKKARNLRKKHQKIKGKKEWQKMIKNTDKVEVKDK